ncbi:epidermal differentiation-specific protein-like [Tachyglossus aculeatus]|uniref:epidermal differentiation-specific protein-like n=1 Tax=Tachyglossus aculeatus TaxID=9261 RepID=UPI0018F512F6|nr:epidermal differentiation-specific protein-like [Tachyglossus aculeatus]
MNKIIVFDQPGFRGLSEEFTHDIPDLRDVYFDKAISSLKVVGQPWLAFDHVAFRGSVLAFEEGEYSSVGLDDQISSLQLVREDLEDPQITLYEDTALLVPLPPIKKEANISHKDFGKVSGHSIQRGEKCPDYASTLFWKPWLQCVRPLRPGRPVITAEILWEKKKMERERSQVVNLLVGANFTDVAQTYTSTFSEELEVCTTHAFNFEDSGELKVGTRFTVKVETSLNVTVEVGKTQSITTKNKVQELTVQVLKKEVTFQAPVKLTIGRNGKLSTAFGVYRRTSRHCIHVMFKGKELVPAGPEAPRHIPPSWKLLSCFWAWRRRGPRRVPLPAEETPARTPG